MAEVQRCHYEEMKEERKDPYHFSFKLQGNKKQSKRTVIQEEGEPLVTIRNTKISLEDKEHTTCPITLTVSVIRDQTVSVPLRDKDMNFDLDSKTSSDHISTKFDIYPDNEDQTDNEWNSVVA